MTLDELIVDLESAKGPSRDLDAEIYKICVGLRPDESIEIDGTDYHRRYWPGGPEVSYSTLRKYTEFMDAAALLLLPSWRIRTIDASIPSMTSCALIGPLCEGGMQERPVMIPQHVYGIGCTIPLAICIAAVKTRSP